MKMPLIVFLFLCTFCVLNAKSYKAIGVGAGYYNYTEPSYMKEHGAIIRLNATLGYDYQHIFKTEVNANLNAIVGLYETKKKIIFSDDEPDITNTNKASKALIFVSNYEVDYKVGYNLLQSFDVDNSVLYVQSGIGYWYLRDNFFSYERIQQYAYVPIELEGTVRLPDNRALTYLLGYKQFIWGKNFSRSSMTFNKDYRANQNNGFGLRASFGIAFKDKADYNNFIRFIFDYWNIGEAETKWGYYVPVSDVERSIVEPKNHTSIFMIQYGWSF